MSGDFEPTSGPLVTPRGDEGRVSLIGLANYDRVAVNISESGGLLMSSSLVRTLRPGRDTGTRAKKYGSGEVLPGDDRMYAIAFDMDTEMLKNAYPTPSY